MSRTPLPTLTKEDTLSVETEKEDATLPATTKEDVLMAE